MSEMNDDMKAMKDSYLLLLNTTSKMNDDMKATKGSIESLTAEVKAQKEQIEKLEHFRSSCSFSPKIGGNSGEIESESIHSIQSIDNKDKGEHKEIKENVENNDDMEKGSPESVEGSSNGGDNDIPTLPRSRSVRRSGGVLFSRYRSQGREGNEEEQDTGIHAWVFHGLTEDGSSLMECFLLPLVSYTVILLQLLTIFAPSLQFFSEALDVDDDYNDKNCISDMISTFLAKKINIIVIVFTCLYVTAACITDTSHNHNVSQAAQYRVQLLASNGTRSIGKLKRYWISFHLSQIHFLRQYLLPFFIFVAIPNMFILEDTIKPTDILLNIVSLTIILGKFS